MPIYVILSVSAFCHVTSSWCRPLFDHVIMWLDDHVIISEKTVWRKLDGYQFTLHLHLRDSTVEFEIFCIIARVRQFSLWWWPKNNKLETIVVIINRNLLQIRSVIVICSFASRNKYSWFIICNTRIASYYY